MRKRRQRRRTFIRQRLFTVSLCGTAFLIAGLIVLMMLRLHDEGTERTSNLATDAMTSAIASDDHVVTEVSAATSSDRPIYRYSVIPSGAYDARELSDAIRADAVVAAHYTDVSVRNIHVRRVTNPRSVYTSYRLGNRIYWTSKPIALKVGELILDDGVNQIRARCGNRIANDLPPAVTVATDEPALTELDDVQPILPSASVSMPGPGLVGGAVPIAPESGGDTRVAGHHPLGLVLPGIAAGGLMAPRDTQPDGVVAPAGTKAPIDVADATPRGGETPSSVPDPNASPQQPNDPGSNPKQNHPNTPSNPNDPNDPGERVDPGGPVLPVDPETPIPVPEPATIVMVGAGLLATAARRLWLRHR